MLSMLSCLIMSYHVLSRLIMSCHVLPWFFTSYHVITCDFLPFCTSFSFQFRKPRIIEFQNAIISQTAFPWACIFLTTSHFQGFSPGSLGHIVLHARARIVFPGAITWICVLGFPTIEQVHSYCVVLPDMPSLDLWACNFQSQRMKSSIFSLGLTFFHIQEGVTQHAKGIVFSSVFLGP